MAGLVKAPDYKQKLKEYQDKYFLEHPGGDGGFFSLAGTMLGLAAGASMVAGAIGAAGAGAAAGGAGAAGSGAAAGGGSSAWGMAKNALSLGSTVMDLTGSKGKGEEQQQAAAPAGGPDYSKAWQTYAGELQNINVNSNRSIADVRARLSAAGASPDSIKTQTEFLEAQRMNKIGELNQGPSYAALVEGFEIAGGKRTNPYGAAQAPPAEGADVLSYYSTLYGAPASDAGDMGMVRAKQGASGLQGGPSSGITASPWLGQGDNASFW